MVEHIKPKVEDIRDYLDQITDRMHPGDYIDTLSMIVHYACREAIRLARELDSDQPLDLMRKEMLSLLTTQGIEAGTSPLPH